MFEMMDNEWKHFLYTLYLPSITSFGRLIIFHLNILLQANKGKLRRSLLESFAKEFQLLLLFLDKKELSKGTEL